MFLDDHMSSSRRNKKHLKVTFAKFVAAAAEAEVRKDKTETGKLSRYINICSGGHHERFRSLCHFALQRCLKEIKKKENGECLCQLSSSL